MPATEPFYLPENLFYSPVRHLWVRRENGDSKVVVGMDPLGLAALGDLAYIAIAEEGAGVECGERLGTL
ncbi:MAG: hypothetical protein V3S29_04320, partial [bacterium]